MEKKLSQMTCLILALLASVSIISALSTCGTTPTPTPIPPTPTPRPKPGPWSGVLYKASDVMKTGKGDEVGLVGFTLTQDGQVVEGKMEFLILLGGLNTCVIKTEDAVDFHAKVSKDDLSFEVEGSLESSTEAQGILRLRTCTTPGGKKAESENPEGALMVWVASPAEE